LAALASEGETGALALLLDSIDGVRGAEGWLHLEVVGSQEGTGHEPAALVAAHLRDHGASHIARGDIWDDGGNAGWRVTALLPAAKLTACRRALLRLGAGRVVGLSPRVVFDRDGPSTYNNLAARLEGLARTDSSGGAQSAFPDRV
jgi:ATP phosphoribosyltransferase